MLAEFRAVVGGPDLQRPDHPDRLHPRPVRRPRLTPEYWVRHVREAVRFGDAIQTLEAAGRPHLPGAGPRRHADRSGPGLRQRRGRRAASRRPLRRDRARGADLRRPRSPSLHVRGVPGGLVARSSPARAPGGSTCRPTPSSSERLLAPVRGRLVGDVASAGLGAARPPAAGRLAGAGGRPTRMLFTGRSRCWTATRGWPTTRSAGPSCCRARPSSSWRSGPGTRSAAGCWRS